MSGGQETSARGLRPAWLPAWIKGLGTPVWITKSDGTVGYLNKRAETLLGRPASECIGRPCHRIIAGSDSSGRRWCTPNCSVFRLARGNSEIEPVSMRITSASGEFHWVDVLHITLVSPEPTGVWLVHCALGADRAHRIEEYLARVASRSPGHVEMNEPSSRLGLTPRESEILELLARDESLHAIADKTHVSYVTVRNHVQHILAKLGVHSIMEAVACYLLVRD